MSDIFDEGSRQFTVCNSCRYCEGFCPVWPAMERRTVFGKDDLVYLANLCHDCKACYYACPYTEPNEAKINIPQLLSEIRVETYKAYAPSPLSQLFERQKTYFLTTAIGSILALTVLALLIGDPSRLIVPHLEPGAFYDIFPFLGIIVVGLGIGIFVVVNYLRNMSRFYNDIGHNDKHFSFKAVLQGTADVLLHRAFKGGDAGCYHEETKPSYRFLTLHALVFYGFLLAVVSTILAAISQDVFGILPPYPVLSLPVLFGIAGGACMVVGTLAFFVLERRADARPAFKKMVSMDNSFLLTLAAVSITGFLTLIFRSSSLLGIVLTVHLGCILLLFVTAPYGKFVHFTYRYIALIFNRVEEAQQ